MNRSTKETSKLTSKLTSLDPLVLAGVALLLMGSCLIHPGIAVAPTGLLMIGLSDV